MVRVTLPAAMSAAEGKYVLTREDVLLNVPVPLVVQVVEMVPPERVPVTVTEVAVAQTC